MWVVLWITMGKVIRIVDGVEKNMKTVKMLWIMICFILVGCQNPDHGVIQKGKLLITQDFGGQPLENIEVEFAKGDSVLEIVQQYAQVETAYDGGFVNSINGIGSLYTHQQQKDKKDWFYYINGIQGHIGSDDYLPQSGDVLWWDYRSWEGEVMAQAVIGAYPQPFVGGYHNKNNPTVILYSTGRKDTAQELIHSLKKQGVQQIDAKPLDGQYIAKKKNKLIILGTWEELMQIKELQDIYAHSRQTGLFFQVEKDHIVALDATRQSMGKYPKAGIIAATATGFGDPHPIWFITGIDEESVRAALDILLDQPEVLQGKTGVLIQGEEIIPIPIPIKEP